MKKKIVRNLATDEGKAFWASAEKIAAQAQGWPPSKRAGINVSPYRQVETEGPPSRSGHGSGSGSEQSG